MALIYVAEDDEDIREVIRAALTACRFQVKVFPEGQSLLDACREQVPDCCLLDIMMPVLDGVSTLHRLRRSEDTKNCPILMLTAKSSELDKVAGLEAGADDYITKPFAVLELGARVKAALRTASRYRAAAGDPCRRAGDVTVDETTRRVTRDGKALSLTRKEYDLLLALLTAAPAVVSRRDLLETVWGYSYEGESRTLDMHIRSLRAKLGEPSPILTVRGVGYRYQTEGSL